MAEPDEHGLYYAWVRFRGSLELPYLIRQAATRAGFRHSTQWLRDRVARALAAELEEDFEEIMEAMPPDWDKKPGAVRAEGSRKV